MSEPKMITGSRFIDDRGQLNFVNEFDFADIKRHYLVTNHRKGFVRAWHGHKLESKYITMARGSAVVGYVKIDDWTSPCSHPDATRIVLSAEDPKILFIPAGYANGWMSLTDDATLLVFSTTTAAESKIDDYRFPARRWDIWNITER